MRIFRILATVIFMAAIPTALLTTTIRYIANEGRVYRYAIDEFGATSSTGIERSELLRASAELRAFFNNSAETIDIRVQDDGREVSLFNARETTHLVDVKDRFNTMNKVQEFSVLYVMSFIIAVVVWAREMSGRALAVATAASCVLTLALIAVAGALGAAGFDSAWEDFHQIIFSNDFWRLNPRTDHLIQMFPPDFWESIVFFIGLLAAAEAALLLILAGIYFGVSGRESRTRYVDSYYVEDSTH